VLNLVSADFCRHKSLLDAFCRVLPPAVAFCRASRSHPPPNPASAIGLTLPAVRHIDDAKRIAFDDQSVHAFCGQARVAKRADISQRILMPLLPSQCIVPHAPRDLLEPVIGTRPPPAHVFAIAFAMHIPRQLFSRANRNPLEHNHSLRPSRPGRPVNRSRQHASQKDSRLCAIILC
jgi:hypothetical protein